MDILSPAQRSERMSRVRAGGNRSTELRLIALLRQHGIKGWRRGYPLPGKPDFVFPSRRVALFVDGCFWHYCQDHYRRPKSRQEYWDAKVAANVRRDVAISELLQSRGWTVVRLWEHELHAAQVAATVSKITEFLNLSR